MCLHPGHPYVEVDQHLCNQSTDLIDETLKTSHDKAFIALRRLVTELARKGDDASKGVRSDDERNIDDLAIDLHTEQDLGWGIQGWDHDTSEIPFTMPTGFLSLNEFEQAL